MNKTAPLRLDMTWLYGLLLLGLSLFFFCIPTLFHLAEVPEGLFFANYLIAIFYLVIVVAGNRIRVRDENALAPIFVLLVISLVSCYALNRSMGIFEDSVPWWSALLIIVSINFLATPFYSFFPRWLQYLSCTITGIALIAFLYLAIYLVPAYIAGSFGLLALGIGAHVFVPILFVAYSIVFIREAAKANRRSLYAFCFGILIAIGTIVQFTIRWSAEVSRVDRDLFQSPSDNNLPSWITVAQHCRPSSFNEHFIKAGLVYEIPIRASWDFLFFSSHTNYHEQHRHDPLIMIASTLAGQSNLIDDHRIKILESLYDSRHYAQERLWRDDALATTGVKTNVDLYPNLHLSYTEEEVTVAAVNKQDRWPVPQEALYTFHLPEGATVSALSLWIGNHEAKGVFTSRHKVDSAYREIVGYEHRDPSVVHWQEGDKVVVRVFPIDPNTPRRFKIGITAPLEAREKRLFYHSIYFDGPPTGHALGAVKIHPVGPVEGLQQALPKTEAYDADWSLSLNDPGITPQTFTFNGEQYTTEAADPTFNTVDIQKFYLDINRSWTHEEFNALLPLLKDKKVYVWHPTDGLIKLTPANQDEVFDAAANTEFSIFPFQLIADKEHALFISKSTAASPLLSDLNNTDFSTQLQNWLGAPQKLRVYSIGDELSPYLKTLKECGAFHFEKGSWSNLYTHLMDHRLLHDVETPDLVRIDPAGLLIRRSAVDSSAKNAQAPTVPQAPAVAQASTVPQVPTVAQASTAAQASAAPDHLLRLFAYRRIQQQLSGRLPGDYTREDPATVDALATTAQQAGIVSPVSSLVVLETDDDYKKFNITQSQNSLKNATLHSKGSVPEPGEWALLITVLGFLLFIKFRSIKNKTATHAQR